MDAPTDIIPNDLSSLKCFVTWSIGWFLGFTLVLCWSIWQLPDAQGCGIKAAWVPDAFCREACLIVSLPTPLTYLTCKALKRTRTNQKSRPEKGAVDRNLALTQEKQPFCPVVFALPSIFWPVTLVVLVIQQLDRRCGQPFAHRRNAAMTEKQEMQETYRLLPDMEDGVAFDEEGSIPLSDLGESPRSSDDSITRLSYHVRATKAIRKHFSSQFRSTPYQLVPPATMEGRPSDRERTINGA